MKTLLTSLALLLAGTSVSLAYRQVPAPVASHEGEVRDLRVLDHVSNHPGFHRIWQPYIAQWSG